MESNEIEIAHPFWKIVGRPKGLRMIVHKEVYFKYQIDLWNWQEYQVRLKYKFNEEIPINSHIEGLKSMYDYCTKRIREMIGIPASRVGTR